MVASHRLMPLDKLALVFVLVSLVPPEEGGSMKDRERKRDGGGRRSDIRTL